ncbi:DUF288 domain-containing protein [Flagellimonas onchidii]|uniref:DUF288 domain-containing protein n=1 Tax=Flagellimonas onchidii TaxID=2562684 RepID=UPI0010A658ED|nr:DUF288 domain-containing protein [Allomuricauda onchidii]
MGKRYIVITTIFQPTKAVKEFSKKDSFGLIVVGDKKTPFDWKEDNTVYLSVDEQKKCFPNMEELLPCNHYARKNLGYLHAIDNGADIIVDTDDDNIPYKDWSFPNFDGDFFEIRQRSGFVNIYSHYSDQRIWPRGLPLHLINSPDVKIHPNELDKKEVTVGVWQGLADQDPDVDAVYRLVDNVPCIFKKNGNIVLPTGTLSPFNSQNTAFRKELFPLLYIPSTVTMRFSDILRGLVAQPIMWAHGYQLGINEATVYQERNEHNLMKDFEQEIPCYLYAERTVEIVKKAIKSNHTIATNLMNAYQALEKNNIVSSRELHVLGAWLESLQNNLCD